MRRIEPFELGLPGGHEGIIGDGSQGLALKLR